MQACKHFAHKPASSEHASLHASASSIHVLCVQACKSLEGTLCARLQAASVQFVCKLASSLCPSYMQFVCKLASSLRTACIQACVRASKQLAGSLCASLQAAYTRFASISHSSLCTSWQAARLQFVCILHARLRAARVQPGRGGRGGGVLTQVPTWAERRSPSAACKLRSSADTFSSRARRSRSPRRSVSSCSSRAACALPSLPSAPRRPAAARPRVANLSWGLWGAHGALLGLVGCARVGSDSFTRVCAGCVGVLPVLLGCTGGFQLYRGLRGICALFCFVF